MIGLGIPGRRAEPKRHAEPGRSGPAGARAPRRPASNLNECLNASPTGHGRCSPWPRTRRASSTTPSSAPSTSSSACCVRVTAWERRHCERWGSRPPWCGPRWSTSSGRRAPAGRAHRPSRPGPRRSWSSRSGRRCNATTATSGPSTSSSGWSGRGRVHGQGARGLRHGPPRLRRTVDELIAGGVVSLGVGVIPEVEEPVEVADPGDPREPWCPGCHAPSRGRQACLRSLRVPHDDPSIDRGCSPVAYCTRCGTTLQMFERDLAG